MAGFFEYPSEAVSALSDGSSSERSWEEDFGNSSTDATSSQGHTSALLFNSGWDANVSYFSSVPRAGDWIVHDELVHASVWDGMRANERRGVRSDTRRAFKHNDVDDLSRTLLEIIETKPLGQIFIAIETLYSMDGDIAPLEDMCRILSLLQHRHPHVIHPDRVCVVVDEAHTTGVYGRQGRGLVHEVVERMGREGSEVLRWVQVRVMTFGKGVGSQGGEESAHTRGEKNAPCILLCSELTSPVSAVLLASAVTRAYLVNFARPFIFSTAMSVNNVYAIEAAFDVLQHPEAEARRQRLFRLCETLRDEVLALLEKRVPRRVLRLMNSPATTAITTLSGEASDQGRRRPSSATAILPLLTSHPHALAAHLQARGYLVRPVVPPTVPKGLERVRVCLHADNEESDVRKLVKVIGEWAQREIMQNSAKL